MENQVKPTTPAVEGGDHKCPRTGEKIEFKALWNYPEGVWAHSDGTACYCVAPGTRVYTPGFGLMPSAAQPVEGGGYDALSYEAGFLDAQEQAIALVASDEMYRSRIEQMESQRPSAAQPVEAIIPNGPFKGMDISEYLDDCEKSSQAEAESVKQDADGFTQSGKRSADFTQAEAVAGEVGEPRAFMQWFDDGWSPNWFDTFEAAKAAQSASATHGVKSLVFINDTSPTPPEAASSGVREQDFLRAWEYMAAQAEHYIDVETGLKEEYRPLAYAGYCAALSYLAYALNLPVDTEDIDENADSAKRIRGAFPLAPTPTREDVQPATMEVPKADYYVSRPTLLRFANRDVKTDEDADIRAMAIDLLEYLDEEKARDDAEDAAPPVSSTARESDEVKRLRESLDEFRHAAEQYRYYFKCKTLDDFAVQRQFDSLMFDCLESSRSALAPFQPKKEVQK